MGAVHFRKRTDVCCMANAILPPVLTEYKCQSQMDAIHLRVAFVFCQEAGYWKSENLGTAGVSPKAIVLENTQTF